jgi:heme oxygenase
MYGLTANLNQALPAYDRTLNIRGALGASCPSTAAGTRPDIPRMTNTNPKSNPDSIMRRLRSHTAELHARTEELPLMRGLFPATPEHYLRYLQALRIVYDALEPPLYAALPAELVDDLGVTPKLPALARDLAALRARLGETGLGTGLGTRLGTESGTSGLATDLPVPDPMVLPQAAEQRIGAALGGLYVIEGATLGGQVIARRLAQDWPDATPPPLDFLEFRHRCDRNDWRQFGAAVTAWSQRHQEAEDAILAGAVSAFELTHDGLAGARRRRQAAIDHRRPAA